MEVAILQLLGVVVQLAPGLLAKWTKHRTDEEALAAARDAIRAIPTGPARSALDAHEARIAPAPPTPAAHPLDVINAGTNPIEIAERIRRLPPLYRTAIRQALDRVEPSEG